jgi:hypothetical protein
MKFNKLNGNLFFVNIIVLIFCCYLILNVSSNRNSQIFNNNNYNNNNIQNFVNPELKYSTADLRGTNSYSITGIGSANEIIGAGNNPSYTYASYVNRVPASITLPSSVQRISLENKTFLSNSVPLNTFDNTIKQLDIELIKKGMQESQEITERLYNNLNLKKQGCYCQKTSSICNCDEVVR